MNYAYAASTFILFTLGMSLGCHSVKTHSESRIWLSEYNLDNPLVGRIIDVKRERSINESDLVRLSARQNLSCSAKNTTAPIIICNQKCWGDKQTIRGLMEMLTIDQTTQLEALSTVAEI